MGAGQDPEFIGQDRAAFRGPFSGAVEGSEEEEDGVYWGVSVGDLSAFFSDI